MAFDSDTRRAGDKAGIKRESESESENKRIKTEGAPIKSEDAIKAESPAQIKSEVNVEADTEAAEAQAEAEAEEEADDDAPEESFARTVNPDGTVDYEDTVKLWEPGYRERYYRQKFGVELTDTAFRRKVVKAYVEGLCWVLAYYYQLSLIHI